MHVNDDETLHNNDPFRRKLLVCRLFAYETWGPFYYRGLILIDPSMDK